MKKHVLIVILMLACLTPVMGSAFSSHEGCSGKCTECHKLEKKEAEDLIKKMAEKKMIPDSRVLDVKLAPAKGLWEIVVETGDTRGAIYLDFSKKYITGQLIPVDAISKMAPPAPSKVDFSTIPLKNTMLFGPKNATKKVVIITDPDCPYCRKLHEEMKKVLAMRKDVAFHLVLYPLPMHKDAYKKVQTILCSRSEAVLNAAFEGKPLSEPSCSADVVERSKKLVQKLGFNSTPTLIRQDGTVLNGFRPADQLSAWIDGRQ
jgi:thiol:disulfide interchange protein DsbC